MGLRSPIPRSASDSPPGRIPRGGRLAPFGHSVCADARRWSAGIGYPCFRFFESRRSGANFASSRRMRVVALQGIEPWSEWLRTAGWYSVEAREARRAARNTPLGREAAPGLLARDGPAGHAAGPGNPGVCRGLPEGDATLGALLAWIFPTLGDASRDAFLAFVRATASAVSGRGRPWHFSESSKSRSRRNVGGGAGCWDYLLESPPASRALANGYVPSESFRSTKARRRGCSLKYWRPPAL